MREQPRPRMRRTSTSVRRGWASAIILVAVLAWPAAGWSRTTRHACVRPDDIARLLTKWTEALKASWAGGTIDPKIVVGTYAAEGPILVPTCANGPLVGADAITSYFADFLKEKPVAAIDPDTRTIRIGSDCRSAFATGLYTFTLTGSGERLAARYTYIYRLGSNGWRIVHHHSSLQPKPPAACPAH